MRRNAIFVIGEGAVCHVYYQWLPIHLSRANDTITANQIYVCRGKTHLWKIFHRAALAESNITQKISAKQKYANQRLYMWRGNLAGNLILVSITLLFLATFCAWVALQN